MWALLTGLYQYITQKDEYYILIIGLDNAGKTTYLEQTKAKYSPNYKMMNPSKITTNEQKRGNASSSLGRLNI